jgi:hypothetical protein
MIKIKLIFTDRMGRVTGEDEYHATVLPTRSDTITWKSETWRVLETNHVLKESKMMGGLALSEVQVRVVK